MRTKELTKEEIITNLAEDLTKYCLYNIIESSSDYNEFGEYYLKNEIELYILNCIDADLDYWKEGKYDQAVNKIIPDDNFIDDNECKITNEATYLINEELNKNIHNYVSDEELKGIKEFIFS